MTDILTSIHGNRIGLSREGGIILRSESGEGRIAVPSVTYGFKGVRTVTIPAAQVLALNAAPQPIVAAQGANLAIVPYRVALRIAGGAAYAVAAAKDLVLKYANGSGAQCSSAIETTGFLDQASAQIRIAGGPGATGAAAGDFAPVANAAVVLHLLSGEISGGDQDLIVRCWYDVFPTDFA